MASFSIILHPDSESEQALQQHLQTYNQQHQKACSYQTLDLADYPLNLVGSFKDMTAAVDRMEAVKEQAGTIAG